MLADTQESPNTLHTTTPDRTHVSAAVLGEMRNRVTELARRKRVKAPIREGDGNVRSGGDNGGDGDNCVIFTEDVAESEAEDAENDAD